MAFSVLRLLTPFLLVVLAACSGGSPTSPGPVAQRPSTGPQLLVAGNSNAFFLAPYLDGFIDQSNIDGSIDFWLSSPAFSDAARLPNLGALIWWQAGGDIFTPGDEYVDKLRRVIRIARANQSALPVCIVELPDLPNRGHPARGTTSRRERSGGRVDPDGRSQVGRRGGAFHPRGVSNRAGSHLSFTGALT